MTSYNVGLNLVPVACPLPV